MISDPKIKRWITSSREAVSSSQRIGLLGGSFNPAHDGHLSISKIALRRLGLDQIWWIVSPRIHLRNMISCMILKKEFFQQERSLTPIIYPSVNLSLMPKLNIPLAH